MKKVEGSKTMNNTHTFITANYDNYVRCKTAAEKFGMKYHYENKPTCFKQHHTTITAETPEQVHILDILILACTAHPEQGKYKMKLAEMMYN